jgi:hypothetical protein
VDHPLVRVSHARDTTGPHSSASTAEPKHPDRHGPSVADRESASLATPDAADQRVRRQARPGQASPRRSRHAATATRATA